MKLPKYTKLILPIILCIGAFLRWYHLEEQLVFSGDIARDLIISINILLTQKLTLIGPPTSLGWLRLGPFAYYLWALILWLGSLNPLSIALFLIIIDTVNILLIYQLWKEIFSERIALISALLYASSSYAIYYSRLILHISLMPITATLFYLFLVRYLKYRKIIYFYLCCLLLSFAVQVHLTGIILIVIFLYYNLRKITVSKIFLGIILFILPLLPLLIDQYNDKFAMIGKFFLWLPYRIGSFWGLFSNKNSVNMEKLLNIINVNGNVIQDTIFIPSLTLAVLIFGVSIVTIVLTLIGKIESKRSYRSGIKYILTILCLSFLSIFIHNQPSPHYFLFIIPFIILPVAYLFSLSRVGLVFLLFLTVSNISMILK